MKTFSEQMLNKYRKILVPNIEITCDEGWYPLVNNALNVIKQHVEMNKTLTSKVIQIKEKFGALRVVVHPQDKFVEGVVQLTYMISETTCELCGSPAGSIRKGGCAKCLCPTCFEIWKKG